ncbi:MAG: site-specific integrase, partial [Clostridia bacterium]|nr:site-specific integrase [Clostridia bacterium]
MKQNYKNGLPDRLIKYFNYQASVKNKSELTIDEYCINLRLFFKFLLHEKEHLTCPVEDVDISRIDDAFLRTVTLDDAYQFLSYCAIERGNQEKARARKVSAVRTFFKYLKMNNVIDENPMINLDSPKLKKSLPKYLTVDQAKRLLSCIDGANRERNYCIITLFLNCGMRLS